MPELPSGTVTFLFTDIEGSTALWERDRRDGACVARHLTMLDAAIQNHGGVHFKTVGDRAHLLALLAGDDARETSPRSSIDAEAPNYGGLCAISAWDNHAPI